MSNQPKPFEELDIYNSVNYPGSAVSANLLNFPVAQGTETMPYGIIWGDGTYQNSANPGGYSLTVQDGTTTVTNVSDINVTNGTLTNNGGGSVSITTGGGGGSGVQNPMTSDLDGGGFDINNLTNLNILNQATLPTINTKQINNSDPVKYYNQGPVAPGGNNLFYVCTMNPKADGEAHCLVISRCLDPGFKQTSVFSITAFADKASVDVQVNLSESDTPIFNAVVVGENPGTTEMFVAMQCVAPSDTWEIRVYENQDDKGTGSAYGQSWNVISPATSAPTPGTIYASATLFSLNPYGTKTFTGNHVIQGSVDSLSLNATDFVTAGGDVTAGNNVFAGTAVYTNEIRDNGFAPIGVFNSISMQSNDIQSANLVGALGFVGAALNITIPIGDPVSGPLYVDTSSLSAGVGVPSPQDILDVAKSITIRSTTDPQLQFYGTTQAAYMGQIVCSDTLSSGGDLNFLCRENGGSMANKMTIFQDGRVRLTLNRIENMADPIAAQDAATKAYVDASIPSLTGYVTNPMGLDLDGGAFQINNISDPTLAQDAATKAYVDASIPSLAGYVTNPMGSDLDGGAFNLFNIQGVNVNDFVKTGGQISGGTDINAQQNIYAGDAQNFPGLQASVDFVLPSQIASASGVMPRWTNGYLNPQSMSSGCTCGETVTAPGANKLNPVSLISSTIAAYILMVTDPATGNLIIRIPGALDRHTFNVQLTGEWDGSTIGGNGNSYTFLRLDLDPAADIIGLNTGQAIDGARYPLSMNFVGQLREGDYAVFVGHYDLGSSRNYKGRIDVRYIGSF